MPAAMLAHAVNLAAAAVWWLACLAAACAAVPRRGVAGSDKRSVSAAIVACTKRG